MSGKYQIPQGFRTSVSLHSPKKGKPEMIKKIDAWPLDPDSDGSPEKRMIGSDLQDLPQPLERGSFLTQEGGGDLEVSVSWCRAL